MQGREQAGVRRSPFIPTLIRRSPNLVLPAEDERHALRARYEARISELDAKVKAVKSKVGPPWWLAVGGRCRQRGRALAAAAANLDRLALTTNPHPTMPRRRLAILPQARPAAGVGVP